MKTALVTGASGAIGSATAKVFLQNGYFVIAQYNKDQNGINNLKAFAEDNGFLDYLFCELHNIDTKNFSANHCQKLYSLCEYI